MDDDNKCYCGSGQERIAYYDARSIFLTFGCDICWPSKARMFRSDVLTDPCYPTVEDIDPEP